LILWKFSPEKDDDITNANFRNKILYRTALYFCLVGTGVIYLPPMGWLYALCIFVFLGYLIWIVRNSEDLYGLPIYWRFFTSLFAIIDFGVLIYLLWQLI
jgi:hypothetical protein